MPTPRGGNPLAAAVSIRGAHLHPETKPDRPWGPAPGSPSGFPTPQGPWEWDIPENIQMPAPMLGYHAQLGAAPSSVPVFLCSASFISPGNATEMCLKNFLCWLSVASEPGAVPAPQPSSSLGPASSEVMRASKSAGRKTPVRGTEGCELARNGSRTEIRRVFWHGRVAKIRWQIQQGDNTLTR